MSPHSYKRTTKQRKVANANLAKRRNIKNPKMQFVAPQPATFAFPPPTAASKPLAPGETPVCKLERIRKKRKRPASDMAAKANDARLR